MTTRTHATERQTTLATNLDPAPATELAPAPATDSPTNSPLYIYLAGPFFTTEQLNRVRRVQNALAHHPRVNHIDVPFDEEQKLVKDLNLDPDTDRERWSTNIYWRDVNAIHTSDAVVAIADYFPELIQHTIDNDGPYPGSPNQLMDPGTAYEVGFATAIGKPVIIYSETAENNDINFMLTVQAHATVRNSEQLMRALDTLA